MARFNGVVSATGTEGAVDAVGIVGAQRFEGLLLDLLDRLTDEQVRAPSRLPGWTRGHLLAHVAGVGAAVARQLENAAGGREPVDFYDNGQAGRNAAIEAAAADSAAQHATRVRATVGRLVAVRARLTPEVMERPTGHRARPARMLVETWWREVGIHLTDLDLGMANTIWDADFRDHLAEHLAGRVPHGVRVEMIAAFRDERRIVGDGDLVTARGTAEDLVAWLAGRDPFLPMVFERSGVRIAPPELGPWP